MWVLCMNDMRSPKVEILQPVARAETRAELEALTNERDAMYAWRKAARALLEKPHD